MLDFNSVKFEKSNTKGRIQIQESNKKDIAVIGISIKLPGANTLDEFWNILKNGTDCVGKIPESRKKDFKDILRAFNYADADFNDIEAAFLEETDKFDYRYFKLSPKEAKLMDPNQRMFLETAWEAIEDAGYGGDLLKGSRTGVYVGFSSDSEYKRLITETDPEALSIAVPGNVKPILAGRLSYLMDFKGPNMIVDTTCSSSLVAVHLACRAIRNGECSLAVVGGAQTHLVPLRQAYIGIESTDGRAKTFDERSNGTGTGEGIIAMLLKPLWEAQKDRDNIYAVIKGSAVNHDGNSIGITAPNATAQEDVIVNAWKDAGIDPETITYIEAHGTGTKLGDPIEIEGIQRAFLKFTRKKQFCAVGSVKTTLGHLDNTAGIVGLLKAVLALKNRKLPPTLHFKVPNKRIDFENSPVYVNDRLNDWETEGLKRRCGISSFGMSGTNCHIILEEYLEENESLEPEKHLPGILVLSAKSRNSLEQLINQYRVFLRKNRRLLNDICFTANTGRGHYEFRTAFVWRDSNDLLGMLDNFILSSETQNGFYGEHKINNTKVSATHDTGVTAEELQELSEQANSFIAQFMDSGKSDLELLRKIGGLYAAGANVEWEQLYRDDRRRRVSVPFYPFERSRCWVDMNKPLKKAFVSAKQTGFTLLDKLLAESMDIEIYSTHFSSDKYWVLNEHVIDGKCILVGTTYFQLIMEACKERYNNKLELKDVRIISPFIAVPGEMYETQLVFRKEADFLSFYVVSRKTHDTDADLEWNRHIEGKVYKVYENNVNKVDIDKIKSGYMEGRYVPDLKQYNDTTVFELGPRWNSIREMYIGDRELISYLELPAEYVPEIKDYFLHPSLMDNAFTAIPLLNKVLGRDAEGKDSEFIYLPFSYGSIKILGPLNERLYSFVKIKGDVTEESELVCFDMQFSDVSGQVLVEIQDYRLKKTSKHKFNLINERKKKMFHTLKWEETEINQAVIDRDNGKILVFKDKEGTGKELIRELKNAGRNVIEVEWGTHFEKISEDRYATAIEDDYGSLLDALKGEKISQALMFSTVTSGSAESTAQLEENLNRSVYGLFRLSRMISQKGLKGLNSVVIISKYANRVTGREKGVIPENAAMFGLARVLDEECPNIRYRCIDIDDDTDTGNLYRELSCNDNIYQAAYREGKRYVEVLYDLEIEDIQSEDIKLKTEGVYIITGGAGGIGLEVAKNLAQKAPVSLALINRAGMPDREWWDRILALGEDKKLCKKIHAIRDIESLGSKVMVCSTDVSSYTQMEQLLDKIRKDSGRINGVIHCAGISGDGFVINKNETEFKRVLSPKIQGTWNIDKLTQCDNLDFFIMFSSNNTLLGVPGQGDYTAANAYLDCFSTYRNIAGKRAITMNWPAWKETGMAYEYGVNSDGIMKAISTSEAMDTFEKFMYSRTHRVIVGELNPEGTLYGYSLFDLKLRLSKEIASRLHKKGGNTQPRDGESGKIADDTVVLRGKPDDKYTENEINIGLIWKKVLGYEEIGVNESFFDIGGDSILLSKVYTAIENKYPGKVQMGDLFSYTSVSQLAAYIDSQNETGSTAKKTVKQDKKSIEQAILDIFEEVEKGYITSEQANEMVLRLQND